MCERGKIDLFLGGDLGLWVLKEVERQEVCRVFGVEDALVDQARRLGFEASAGKLCEGEYEPARFGLSVHYPRLFAVEFIARYESIYNLHPGYLPWGRGYYPVFWALWEGTKSGATFHIINDGVDKGPIVDQIEVEVLEHDTGTTLLERVRGAEQELFRRYWKKLTKGERLTTSEQGRASSYHSREDFLELRDRTDWKSLEASELVRLARALTCREYPGLRIEVEGRSMELRVIDRNEVST